MTEPMLARLTKATRGNLRESWPKGTVGILTEAMFVTGIFSVYEGDSLQDLFIVNLENVEVRATEKAA